MQTKGLKSGGFSGKSIDWERPRLVLTFGLLSFAYNGSFNRYMKSKFISFNSFKFNVSATCTSVQHLLFWVQWNYILIASASENLSNYFYFLLFIFRFKDVWIVWGRGAAIARRLGFNFFLLPFKMQACDIAADRAARFCATPFFFGRWLRFFLVVLVLWGFV